MTEPEWPTIDKAVKNCTNIIGAARNAAGIILIDAVWIVEEYGRVYTWDLNPLDFSRRRLNHFLRESGEAAKRVILADLELIDAKRDGQPVAFGDVVGTTAHQAAISFARKVGVTIILALNSPDTAAPRWPTDGLMSEDYVVRFKKNWQRIRDDLGKLKVGNKVELSAAMDIESKHAWLAALKRESNAMSEERVWTYEGINAWTPARVAEKRYGEIIALLPAAKHGQRLVDHLAVLACDVVPGLQPDKFAEMCVEERLPHLEQTLEWHLNKDKRSSVAAIEVTTQSLPVSSKKPRRVPLNEQMRNVYTSDKSSIDWTSAKWAEKLDCDESSVRKTDMWKRVLPADRALLKGQSVTMARRNASVK